MIRLHLRYNSISLISTLVPRHVLRCTVIRFIYADEGKLYYVPDSLFSLGLLLSNIYYSPVTKRRVIVRTGSDDDRSGFPIRQEPTLSNLFLRILKVHLQASTYFYCSDLITGLRQKLNDWNAKIIWTKN